MLSNKTGQVTVKGYNKSHVFTIEKTEVGSYKFTRLLKNGNVVLNCTDHEFQKFCKLFKEH